MRPIMALLTDCKSFMRCELLRQSYSSKNKEFSINVRVYEKVVVGRKSRCSKNEVFHGLFAEIVKKNSLKLSFSTTNFNVVT